MYKLNFWGTVIRSDDGAIVIRFGIQGGIERYSENGKSYFVRSERIAANTGLRGVILYRPGIVAWKENPSLEDYKKSVDSETEESIVNNIQQAFDEVGLDLIIA